MYRDARVNPVDLVKSFLNLLFESDSYSNEHLATTSIYYLLAKLGVDTAENGPLKVCQKSLMS